MRQDDCESSRESWLFHLSVSVHHTHILHLLHLLSLPLFSIYIFESIRQDEFSWFSFARVGSTQWSAYFQQITFISEIHEKLVSAVMERKASLKSIKCCLSLHSSAVESNHCSNLSLKRTYKTRKPLKSVMRKTMKKVTQGEKSLLF